MLSVWYTLLLALDVTAILASPGIWEDAACGTLLENGKKIRGGSIGIHLMPPRRTRHWAACCPLHARTLPPAQP